MDDAERSRINVLATGPTEDMNRELLYGLSSLNEKVDKLNGTVQEHDGWIDGLRIWQAEVRGALKSSDTFWIKAATVAAAIASVAAVLASLGTFS